MWDLNYIDYIIIAIFLLSILAGLVRGFIREVIALATWVAAFVVASMYATPLAGALTHTSENAAQSLSLVSVAVSFICIFIVILLIGMLVSYILSSLVEMGGISFFNRLLGAIFGFARGFFVVLLLVFLVQLTSFAKSDQWVGSRLLNAFQPAVKWVQDTISPNFDNLRRIAQEQINQVKATSVKQKEKPSQDKTD